MRVAGFVRDVPNGNPVGGARVSLRKVSDNQRVDSTTTDAAGYWSFALAGYPEGPYLVEVTDGGQRREVSLEPQPQFGPLFAAELPVALSALGNGVVPGLGSMLAVTVASAAARTLTVGTGTALVRGYPVVVHSPETLTLSAQASGSRTDAIVVRCVPYGAGNEGRSSIAVLEGTTTLVQTSDLWEEPLAYATVTPSGVSQVTDARTWVLTGTRNRRATVFGVARGGSFEPSGTGMEDATGYNVDVALDDGVTYDVIARCDLVAEGSVTVAPYIGGTGEAAPEVENPVDGVGSVFNAHARTLTGTGAAVSCGVVARATDAVGSLQYDRQWGSSGSAAGQFNRPWGVHVEGSAVWVADALNNRLQRFTTGGTWQQTVGSSGTGAGQLNSPNDVCVRPNDGLLIVADTGNARLQWFNPTTGAYAWHFALGAHPWGVAADATYVYVTHPLVGLVSRIRHSDASAINWSTGLATPRGVAVNPANGFVYVADAGTEKIHVFDVNGNAQFSFGAAGSGDGQFSDPSGVDCDGAGFVYVADAGNNRWQKFTAGGTFVAKFGTAGAGDGQFSFPLGVAVGSDSAVYLADTDNHRVQVYALDVPVQRLLGGVLSVTAIPRR